MKAVEMDMTYHQCLMIKIMNLINKKLTNLDSITFNRDPSCDNELPKKNMSLMK